MANNADRQFNPVKEGLEQTGLYHSIELPNGRILAGAMPIEYQQSRLKAFNLPDSLQATRVLDIGPWDGWFTFELEKLGADVTAIDYVDYDTFRAFHAIFASKARYLQMDVYDLDPKGFGIFDVVLFLGVLYHLKHPLLALEKICACTTDRCIIESFVTDGDEFIKGQSSPIPTLEFYERGELSGQLDNWYGPTVSALSALARTAGFACTEVLRVGGTSACIAAYRKWRVLPPEKSLPPVITGLSSHRNKGKSFESAQEEYIELWCQWNELEPSPTLDQVVPEVDEFGVSPLSGTVSGPSLLINFRLPPGLRSGLHHARIKIGDSHWAEACEFHVDLSQVANEIFILSVQDGLSWSSGSVSWDNGGWATAWVQGLTQEADAGNTSIWISGIPHPILAVFPEAGQVNFKLRALITSGSHSIEVEHRSFRSQPMPFEVDGVAPPIRGLESLRAR